MHTDELRLHPLQVVLPADLPAGEAVPDLPEKRLGRDHPNIGPSTSFDAFLVPPDRLKRFRWESLYPKNEKSWRRSRTNVLSGRSSSSTIPRRASAFSCRSRRAVGTRRSLASIAVVTGYASRRYR